MASRKEGIVVAEPDMTSILTTIKKMLGIESEYTQFDPEIIVHINTVLMTLNQLGVGSEEGFVVADSTDTWSDYLGEDSNLEAVKSYIYISVRLIFDPPSSASILAAFERTKSELEWRLTLQAEEVVE